MHNMLFELEVWLEVKGDLVLILSNNRNISGHVHSIDYENNVVKITGSGKMCYAVAIDSIVAISWVGTHD